MEAAAAEENFRAYQTKVDKRFRDVETKIDTKFEATDGAILALDGVVQGHIAKTASQVTSLQEETKSLKETAESQQEETRRLKETAESLQEMLKNLRGKITEGQAVQARQSRGRSASALLVSPSVAQQFKKPRCTDPTYPNLTEPSLGYPSRA